MHSILIAAGGTGGHVFPGITVAEIFSQRHVKVQWIGTESGIESRLVPNANIPFYTLSVRALRGKNIFSRIIAFGYLVISIISSIIVLFKLRPSLVLGMGGYASGPCGFAAWLLQIPVVIHEQNSVPGLTNRLLSKISSRILLGYKGAFKNNSSKIIYTGNPVRKLMLNAAEPIKRLKDREGGFRIFVMGGSQGAAAINNVLPQAIKAVQGEQLFKIVHQTGENSLNDVMNAYEGMGIEANVFSFSENIADHFQWADIVIARAGALTIAEIMAVGVASILIPYPYAVDDHQTFNARPLVEVGAALLIEEKNLTVASLAQALLKFDRNKISTMSLAACELAKPSAAEDVADICLKLIEANE